MDFNAFVSINIEIKIESFGFYFLLSKAAACFFTENERYLALRELLDLQVGFFEVAIGGRKISSIQLSLCMLEWAGQLIIIRATFLFWTLNFQTISLVQSLNNSDEIQLFGYA